MRVLVRTDDETELQKTAVSRGRRRRVWGVADGLQKVNFCADGLISCLRVFGLRVNARPVADGPRGVGDGLPKFQKLKSCYLSYFMYRRLRFVIRGLRRTFQT
ncbi:hypothetical protein HanPSC8_Chr05g0222361 [Helianthus annuus]|nr:hypothetical protein HanPSC8_Chr05g0222361 [Helianthus annuus]